jgi:hypothetical protein
MLLAMAGLSLAPGGHAAAIGTITQVEGEADLLKSGQPPAIPVEVQAGVEMKDAIHTKAESRVELRFLDNTTPA